MKQQMVVLRGQQISVAYCQSIIDSSRIPWAIVLANWANIPVSGRARHDIHPMKPLLYRSPPEAYQLLWIIGRTSRLDAKSLNLVYMSA